VHMSKLVQKTFLTNFLVVHKKCVWPHFYISMADSVDMIEVACLHVAQYGVLLVLRYIINGNAG